MCDRARDRSDSVVTCHNSAELASIGGGGGRPAESLAAAPNLEVTIGIAVTVSDAAPEGAHLNRVRIEGGGAAQASVANEPIVVSATAAPAASFNVIGWNVWFSNADSSNDAQAGSTPYLASFNLDFPTKLDREGELERGRTPQRDRRPAARPRRQPDGCAPLLALGVRGGSVPRQQRGRVRDHGFDRHLRRKTLACTT